MNVLITGAGRGIGLGFVRYYLKQGANVWACYRSDDSLLREINDDRLTIVEWDVTDDLPGHILECFPSKLDLLINNAGIYGPNKQQGQCLDNITAESMLSVFNINCVAPIRVVQCLKNRLISAKGRVANISSKMGSIEENSSGGCYAYRASKVALVMASKSMAIDLAPYAVRVLSLHPGWVRTDMTSQQGLISVDESVAGMASVIVNIDQYSPGTFVKFNGEVIPY
ncbi:MAG TPA: SDR family oxidoreductase [Candidatus Tenderia electrophaga]|uniref:SDR family oxidoreductase n=1 Tax=Candidatus Tenderia electrophaga TaxID=1748243 RepID=A0A832J6P3_9GAMM|nr:SDR family oxidoreductase [Candidatus Tenderia electrophaga]